MYSQEQAKGSGYPCIAVFNCFYCMYLIKKKAKIYTHFFKKMSYIFASVFASVNLVAMPIRVYPQSWSAGTAEVSYRIFSESRK